MAYNVYKDVNGQWRWYLRATNGRRIATSGEGYYNKQDCLDAIESLRVHSPQLAACELSNSFSYSAACCGDFDWSES
jgi:uncharacterized protein YegP (UPF0339 family)